MCWKLAMPTWNHKLQFRSMPPWPLHMQVSCRLYYLENLTCYNQARICWIWNSRGQMQMRIAKSSTLFQWRSILLKTWVQILFVQIILNCDSIRECKGSENWHCESVSDNYNFARCVNDRCECKTDLGFVPSIPSTSNKCRCEETIVWEDDIPNCVAQSSTPME